MAAAPTFMLTTAKIRQDTEALHVDFDVGNLFRDEAGTMPIAGFLSEDSHSVQPFRKSGRTINGHLRLHTTDDMLINQQIYRIENGVVTGRFTVAGDRKVDGEHGYLLNELHPAVG